MQTDAVLLKYVQPRGCARLREMTGHDEEAVDDSSTRSAIDLLDRLLTEAEGCIVGPGSAGNLTAADRDRLLAAIYRRAFGDRIVSTIACKSCATLFDISFSLTDLVSTLEKSCVSAEQLSDGRWKLHDGNTVRLPTGHDECDVATLPATEAARSLYERCVGQGQETMQIDRLGTVLEQLAPVMDLELDAKCPECSRHELVRFNMQTFLLQALRQERRQLRMDVHRLALAYGWSRDAILSLKRGDRRAHVSLVETERSTRRRMTV